MESRSNVLVFGAPDGAELHVSMDDFGMKLLVGNKVVVDVNSRGLFQIELKRERGVSWAFAVLH